MLIPVVLFAVGLVLLIKGGDWFVDGAVGIARRFHLPELLIGATVVSIGTTLPEVMVSATSAVSGHSQIAYGNAIGSVICNTALICALSATIRPTKVNKNTLKLPIAFFFIAAVFYAVIAYTTGRFSRPVGIILLAIFVIYIVVSIRQMKAHPEMAEELIEETGEGKKDDPVWKMILLLIIGAVLITIGARFLVNNGTLIAEALGVPESVIALTLVALGTSLPELVTAISALAKGHSALSLGNVIGANLFNLVLVCGVSATLTPFSIPANSTIGGFNSSLVVELPVMFAVMIILAVVPLVKGKMKRLQGIILLAIYAAFCVYQFALA
ncbi:MAG: calcium/sodium antiporter [Clostridiales bacterium]|nr:calcium/sodium antiporter [Clostridiales bacterium]